MRFSRFIPMALLLLVACSAAPASEYGGAAVQAAPQTVLPPRMDDSSTAQSQIIGPGPVGSPMRPVEIVERSPLPGLYQKEGWLTVSNTDWSSYWLQIVPGNKRLFVSASPNGGMEIRSGTSVSFNLRKETYKLYGDNGNSVSVKVREGEPTTLLFAPLGTVGNSGMAARVQDRDKIRTEVLMDYYVPPPTVIVQPAPTYVIPSAPVIVEPGPIYVPARPYYRRPGYYRHYGW